MIIILILTGNNLKKVEPVNPQSETLLIKDVNYFSSLHIAMIMKIVVMKVTDQS